MAPIRRNKNRSHQNQQGLVVPDWQPELKLRDHPDPDHVPEDYSDVVNPETDVLAPETYQDMERRLPPQLLRATRHEKLLIMRGIIRNHLPAPAKGIMPLHPKLYTMNPAAFFLPSFLRAIRGNTAESFMDIIHEVIAPSVYAFPMLRPVFCEMLMDEVENFLKWAHINKQKIMMPNTLDKHGSGVAISEIGMQGMLDELMKKFISPLSTVLFPGVGGGSLDSQHSFVVSYSGADSGLVQKYAGMHMEGGHVVLNVCLGKQFTGGEMHFCGRRCANHMNSETHAEERVEYSHVRGQALLFHGNHRHYVHPTTTGFRANMTIWCKSSFYEEMMKSRKNFHWCRKCLSKENI
ncbi:hypothetical protein QYE76_050330 [Lolium multiflorum]|uniref:Fe2OG dioxygenase domain-containing protein n=1 Tax=Lolium multiflorum TaxID=4521 RepID=A0AAD8WHQ4_LOLMU|nr:hypothetical protein QYE76_050330 [Lolium multiflorum]